MAREQRLKSVDITDIRSIPDLLRLVQEVHSTGEPRILRHENQDVAIVQPVKRAVRKPSIKGRPTSASDPFWNIIGIAKGPDDGVTDVSANKHKYLADAYADLHE